MKLDSRSHGHRFALVVVVLGLCLVLAAYLGAWVSGGAFERGIWLMIAGVALVLPATIVLGGSRRGFISRPLLLSALFLFLMLAVGFGAALLLPAETVDGPFFLGVPLRAAIILFGIGIAPSLLLPLAYAADFDATPLDPASLGALRTECERLRSESRRGAGE